MNKTPTKKTAKPDPKKVHRSYPGDGKWVMKPRRSEILICGFCTGKYIKTRNGQTGCVRCTFRIKSA